MLGKTKGQKVLEATKIIQYVSPRGYGGGKAWQVVVRYDDNSKVEIDPKKFIQLCKLSRDFHEQ